MTTTIKNTLASIETLLKSTVGVRKTVTMTAPQFIQYAHAEVTKAAGEPIARSTARLKSLLEAVTVFKDNYVDDESGGITVPLTFDDTTALKEKETELVDAASNGSATPATAAFSKAFTDKIASLKLAAEKLKSAGDEEETEKKGKPFPGAAKPFGKPGEKPAEGEEETKAEKAGGEGDDTMGATAAEPPAGTEEETDEEKKKAKKALAKGLDVSEDGTGWPADLNDPVFQKDGVITKSIAWGADGKPPT